MASKADTRAAILVLSKELGVEPPANLEQIDKLEPLEKILKELEAKKAPPTIGGEGGTPPTAGPAANSQPEQTAPDASPEQATPKVGRTIYVVAEGRAVTTKRGQIGALETVWPEDFPAGAETLAELVAGGFVTATEV